MDIFSEKVQKFAPLAERMRPATLDDFVGQAGIVGEGTLLRRAISADRLGSCIFYGPPGTGKTTLAHIVASNTNGEFVKLNAVSSGVADAKKVIDDARASLKIYGKRTYLLLDECHRWSKAQSDCVLSAIEDGSILFIGSTTENPYVSMTRAIVSRCRIFEFLPLSEEDIIGAMRRALISDSQMSAINPEVTDGALKHLAWACAGDLRAALNALELAVITTPAKDGRIYVDETAASQSIQKKILSVDETTYYDMLSAFCKSLRGSDPNAALYWSQRLIKAGCDPMLICRRLIVHASEDVGLADSNALNTAVNAALAFERLGTPEGVIPLSHAIIYVCLAPKSNSVVAAMGAAGEAVTEHMDDDVPFYLRAGNRPHTGDDGTKYIYPHDHGGYVRQQYLPDSLAGQIYYRPGENGLEKKIAQFYYELIEGNQKPTK